MYCLRCGTKVDDKAITCPHCNANIKEEYARYNYVPRNETNNKNTHDDQYLYSVKYSYGNEEDFIQAYVGKNYEKIKKSDFSIPSFFLGPFYFCYRKYSVLAIIWIICFFLFFTTGVIPLIMAIASGFLFPKIYLQEVKKRTKEIRLKNKNQGKEAIKEICSKKGGTSIVRPIILLVIIISIISAIYYIATEPFEEKPLEKNTPYQVGNITYTIPKGYEEGDYTTDDYKYYSAMKEDTYCNITITNITYSDLYENGEDYLNENIYTNENDLVEPTQQITINNKTWLHKKITSEYEVENNYLLEGKTFYKVETSNDVNSALCDEDFSNILNSIKYKE